MVYDNDPYNEVSIAIVLRQPGSRKPAPLQLLQTRGDVHVLALPVTTEIARVRGVYGYQLPKWLTRIDVAIKKGVHASIETPMAPPTSHCEPHSPVPYRSVTVAHGDEYDCPFGGRKMASDLASFKYLSFAQKLLPRNLKLERGNGPMSDLLNGLGASKIVRMDVVKDAQLVLNTPTPLKTLRLCLAEDGEIYLAGRGSILAVERTSKWLSAYFWR